MITEQQAIEAARQFVNARKHTPWDEASIQVTLGEKQGRQAFIVRARDAAPQGEPDWMQAPEVPVQYLVDAASGAVFGIVTERGSTLFTSA